jgi:hypothetical protein
MLLETQRRILSNKLIFFVSCPVMTDPREIQVHSKSYSFHIFNEYVMGKIILITQSLSLII